MSDLHPNTIAYDPMGRQIVTTDANSVETSAVLDGFGRPIQTWMIRAVTRWAKPAASHLDEVVHVGNDVVEVLIDAADNSDPASISRTDS